MRMDKLTTKFQVALSDAQSLAVGNDHQFLEPVHLMAALLDQQGATVRHLLAQAGGERERPSLAARHRARLAAEGRRHGWRRAGVERAGALPQSLRQARAEAQGSVHIERAVRARLPRSRRTHRRVARTQRRVPGIDHEGDRRDSRRGIGDRSGCGGAPPGAREVHHQSDRARRTGQARSGHRAR